ncbi:MAG: cytochrome c maturation protein CcmE [Acidobacteria bacterium]|nr:cytochrome c maturation protein CcmE [Acidobacteriota bacterium]
MSQLKFLAIALLFIGVVGYLLFSGLQETVYYYTVGEVLAADFQPHSRGIRLTGTVVAGSVTRQPDSLVMDFLLADDQTGDTLKIHYQGVVPDSFKEDRHVVVEGTFHPDRRQFEAGNLLVKCPSKYEEEKAST